VDIDELRSRLSQTPTLRPEGRVLSVTGLGIRVSMPGARIGDVIQIERRSGALVEAEIVGFDEGQAVAVPLGNLTGVGPDEPVHTTGAPLQVRAGVGLLGRIVDGLGRPLDGEPLPSGLQIVPVDRAPPPALARCSIQSPLVTGIRAIDGFLTIGIGQRVGLFAGSGVGKSTLLGALARGALADAVVVALIGERGREVVEFLDNSLGIEGRRRSIMVVTTSDASALERLRAAHVATALAEAMRDNGANVLLLVDSVTRFARAQREVGLAAGEPPARRGYPPSVFAALPRLLERAGTAAVGSITAVYTVLVEGDDMDEPIADEVRGILDGHIVLDRNLASHGHYPAIDVVRSTSRLMPSLIRRDRLAAANSVRSLISAYEQKRDLILLGGYSRGSDSRLDRAIAAKGEIDEFLRQGEVERSEFEETWSRLAQLARRNQIGDAA
jgi:type III secretion protein N (ATPase)